MTREPKIFLKTSSDRPDFRLVKTWLWDETHNTDSDGNSYNPASRHWTDLYLSSRQNSNETIEIYPASEDPLILQINGSTNEIVSRAAYFLALETGGQLFKDESLSNDIKLEDLKLQVGNFDIETAIKRTKESIWRKSSIDNPYPNLTK
jgi:hypothetical protein